MSLYKNVFVFLVTGDQGRSVARYLSEAGYNITGLTRNATSPAAQELAKQGVNIVQGDMSDVSTYSQHLQGMDVAYLNANSIGILASAGFKEEEAFQIEERQTINAAQEAVKRGVKHLIYSALEEFPDGHETAWHMRCKNTVKNAIKGINIPTTYLYPATYYENATKVGLLKKTGPGRFTLFIPLPDDAKLASFSVAQTGGWVKAILDDPKAYVGKDVDACGEYVSIGDMANTISETFNVQVDTLHFTRDKFFSAENRGKPTPQVWLSFKAQLEGYFVRDVKASETVFPGVWTYRQWAEHSQELRDLINS